MSRLGEKTRPRILAELRAARGGLDVEQLAERLDVHPNTVRWHLGNLRDAGVLESRPAERSVPGRPRILYRLRPEAAAESREEYRLLATILAGTVAQSEDGPGRAEEAGRAWGRYLVRRPLPLVGTSDELATAEVTELLDAQGFAAEADGDEIRMRRCPYHELAEMHPDVVCALHRGLIGGALEELGSDLAVEGLDVFVRPDLCVARLAKTRSRDGAGAGSRRP